MGIDILGIDIVGVDILGIDIPAPTRFNAPVLASLPLVVTARLCQKCFLLSRTVSRGYEQPHESNKTTKLTTHLHSSQRPTCRKPYYTHFDVNMASSQYISVTFSVDFRFSDS